MPYSIETPRLLLRPWQRNDFAPFTQMNASPELMRYFPQPLSTAKSTVTWTPTVFLKNHDECDLNQSIHILTN